MAKNLVLGSILAHLAQIREAKNIFFMVSYHHVQHQKKLMIQSWENLVTDGQTDGPRDEKNFVGCCPTNVERPILMVSKFCRCLIHFHVSLTIVSLKKDNFWQCSLCGTFQLFFLIRAPFLWYSNFYIIKHSVNSKEVATPWWVYFWIYLLNLKWVDHENWPTNRYGHEQHS